MRLRRLVYAAVCLIALLVVARNRMLAAADGEQHFLYVAVPGIRNYVEYGGVGILVYDMDHDHKFRRSAWKTAYVLDGLFFRDRVDAVCYLVALGFGWQEAGEYLGLLPMRAGN